MSNPTPHRPSESRPAALWPHRAPWPGVRRALPAGAGRLVTELKHPPQTRRILARAR